ncbi:MAG: DUF86 domain-containing protein [Leptospiraceae bacterium]|nr:DUF86 domain-containing protein [Leptospiraceae bacterium]
MKEGISDKLRIEHAIQAAEEIESYVFGKTFKEFNSDSMLKSACMHQLAVIGDAFANLSRRIKDENNDIDWTGWIGLRIKVVHVYFGIDYQIIWNIINEELSDLKEKLNQIYSSLLL